MPKTDRLSPGAVKLIQEPQYAHFVTMNPDGSPQLTIMWVDVEPDGSHVLINTAEGRVKLRNTASDKRVIVSVLDKDNPWRYAIVKGEIVAHITEGAAEHIDSLAKKYLGKDKYPFGGPSRVILKIKPTSVLELGV